MQKKKSELTLEEAVLLSMRTTRGGENRNVRRFPCGDELDRKIIKISLPAILNFAINPLVGAIDLFWVGRMGNALAIAGQAAANQIYNSFSLLLNFLPAGERKLTCINIL